MPMLLLPRKSASTSTPSRLGRCLLAGLVLWLVYGALTGFAVDMRAELIHDLNTQE